MWLSVLDRNVAQGQAIREWRRKGTRRRTSARMKVSLTRATRGVVTSASGVKTKQGVLRQQRINICGANTTTSVLSSSLSSRRKSVVERGTVSCRSETETTGGSPLASGAEASENNNNDDQVCNCGSCDGEGRIIGGMGSIPGFGWWPIKAYRPCPNYLESGKKYER